MNKIIAYGRNKDDFSLLKQSEIIQSYIKDKGLILKGDFHDVGETDSKWLKFASEVCQKHKFSLLVASHKVLPPDFNESLKLRRTIKVIFCDMDNIESSPFVDLAINMQAAVNEFYYNVKTQN